jgi:hypothetical protein
LPIAKHVIDKRNVKHQNQTRKNLPRKEEFKQQQNNKGNQYLPRPRAATSVAIKIGLLPDLNSRMT